MLSLIPTSKYDIKEVEAQLNLLFDNDNDSGLQEFLVKDKKTTIDLFKYKYLKGMNHDYFIVLDELIIGVAIMWPSARWYSSTVVEIGLFIEKPHRSKGCGSLVIELLESRIPRPDDRCGISTLSPKQTNTRAIELYKRLGYELKNVEPKENGLILMEKLL